VDELSNEMRTIQSEENLERRFLSQSSSSLVGSRRIHGDGNSKLWSSFKKQVKR